MTSGSSFLTAPRSPSGAPFAGSGDHGGGGGTQGWAVLEASDEVDVVGGAGYDWLCVGG
jgi:hypothetical protein